MIEIGHDLFERDAAKRLETVYPAVGCGVVQGKVAIWHLRLDPDDVLAPHGPVLARRVVDVDFVGGQDR